PNYKKEFKLFIKSILKFKAYDFNRLRAFDENENVVLGIGSLLNRSRPRFHIWGTGYMNQHERAKGGILYAVRGRYSAEKLHSEGFEYCDVWGDPALLLPIVYPEKKITKKYALGIIPHLKDYAFFKQMYGSNKKVHVIDLKTSNIEDVLNQMLSCEQIISTSLHGVIVGHAYGIPTIWIKHNDIDTDGFKFKDYFDSVGIKLYNGFTNFDEIIENHVDFFELHKDIHLPTIDLKYMQKRLLEVAPFDVLPYYQ
ncbi:TPA: polysaccharide pyruvyl transferase family protein, partial [Escherichia coli]|nr:polysaccharide pyruvyl transferase family protein [Escherichia coli]HBH9466567.1 polysaccharide pyruvyl transferase family protein [Escherichia coli]